MPRVLLGATGTGPGTGPHDMGEVDLPPGSLLPLYTDGLVERDGMDEDETLAGVR